MYAPEHKTASQKRHSQKRHHTDLWIASNAAPISLHPSLTKQLQGISPAHRFLKVTPADQRHPTKLGQRPSDRARVSAPTLSGEALAHARTFRALHAASKPGDKRPGAMERYAHASKPLNPGSRKPSEVWRCSGFTECESIKEERTRFDGRKGFLFNGTAEQRLPPRPQGGKQ